MQTLNNNKSQNLLTKNHAISPQKKSRNLSTKKSFNLSAKKSRNLHKNKSCNLSDLMSEKNHATSPHTQIMQHLHAQNHATSEQKEIMQNLKNCIGPTIYSCDNSFHPPKKLNITRITKRLPEKITSVVKRVQLLFQKRLGEKKC